jgi:hypothetical protein
MQWPESPEANFEIALGDIEQEGTEQESIDQDV